MTKRHLKLLALAFVPMLLVLLPIQSTAQTEQISTLVVEEGSATVTSTPSGFLVRGSERDVVAGEQVIVTADETISMDAESAATLFLFDGSQITLEADTTLQVQELYADDDSFVVRLNVLSGRVINRVESLIGANDTFEVSSPSSVTTVRGTEYSVEVITATVSLIEVDEGVVVVTESETGNQMEVGAGQTAVITTGQPINVVPTNEDGAGRFDDNDGSSVEDNAQLNIDGTSPDNSSNPAPMSASDDDDEDSSVTSIDAADSDDEDSDSDDEDSDSDDEDSDSDDEDSDSDDEDSGGDDEDSDSDDEDSGGDEDDEDSGGDEDDEDSDDEDSDSDDEDSDSDDEDSDSDDEDSDSDDEDSDSDDEDSGGDEDDEDSDDEDDEDSDDEDDEDSDDEDD